MKKQKKFKLYACGTTWSAEVDKKNQNDLDFYTTKESAWDNLSCARSCGLVEVEVSLKRIVLKEAPRAYLTQRQREKNNERVKSRQRKYVALAEKLLAFAKKSSSDGEVILSAAKWMLGGLVRERRVKRRDSRKRKNPLHQKRRA